MAAAREQCNALPVTRALSIRVHTSRGMRYVFCGGWSREEGRVVRCRTGSAKSTHPVAVLISAKRAPVSMQRAQQKQSSPAGWDAWSVPNADADAAFTRSWRQHSGLARSKAVQARRTTATT